MSEIPSQSMCISYQTRRSAISVLHKILLNLKLHSFISTPSETNVDQLQTWCAAQQTGNGVKIRIPKTEQLVRTNSKENAEAPHYFPLEEGIHVWPVDSPRKVWRDQ